MVQDRLVPERSLAVDLVPTEIWLLCWDLCSYSEISRLSLVCKRFRIISLPFLFKHQSLDLAAMEQGLDQNNFVDRLDYMRRAAVRVENLTDPSFAALPLIESWTVRFGYEHALSSKKQDIDIEDLRLFNKLRARIMETFCKTLHIYPNLSSLDMERYTVDTAFLTMLAGLPHLRDLRLHIPDKSSVSYSGGNLTMPNLRRLDISRHALLLDGFTRRISLPNLVDLRIGVVRNTEVVFAHVAERFPLLERLGVDVIQDYSSEPVPELPVGSLPNLREIIGPQGMVDGLVPGRSISRVVVGNGGTWAGATSGRRFGAFSRSLAAPRQTSPMAATPSVGELSRGLSLHPPAGM
ncbi:hypothetical protein R3P38DRAFT_1321496 [Favolaschia claudopus]|uniref:F-box domain-containing protein n=1 Tax=Favolaschia claudopus TaxID=2862362 RepID=A0AAW0AV09_9AGAR